MVRGVVSPMVRAIALNPVTLGQARRALPGVELD
jgi:hypothetical protein